MRTKQEIIKEFGLDSNFRYIDTRLDTYGNYKGKWELLIPKYEVVVNNERFDYSLPAQFLGECFDIKSPLYLHDDRIYQDMKHGSRNRYNHEQKLMRPSLKNISDVQKNLKTKYHKLYEDNLLFAFRAILGDAFVKFECDDVWDFMEQFGYECGRDAQKAYDSCVETYRKLNLSEDKILSLFDELSELEIE